MLTIRTAGALSCAERADAKVLSARGDSAFSEGYLAGKRRIRAGLRRAAGEERPAGGRMRGRGGRGGSALALALVLRMCCAVGAARAQSVED